jgi:Tat protein secretion system quality control protein TatD with DNase activity
VHGFFIGSYENRADYRKIKAYIEIVNSVNKVIKNDLADPDDVKAVVKKINGGNLLTDSAAPYAAPYTKFNETRFCPVVVYHQNKIIDSKSWDEELWVERGEDYYGLMSSQLVNKKVRVIDREEWLKSPVIVKDINYIDKG